MRKNAIRYLVVMLVMAALPATAHARKFANPFIEFEIPDNWTCGLEGVQWMCQLQDSAKKREAVMVFVSKMKGPADTPQKYKDYLSKPKTFTGPGGKTIKSAPQPVVDITLDGQPWVDATHLESEVPGFYTRYLATIKQDIAVLVTYSVEKGKFEQYKPVFDGIVRTIRVFQPVDKPMAKANDSLFNQARMPTDNARLDPKAGGPGVEYAKKGESEGGSAGAAAAGVLVLLAAGAGGFVYYRKKKSGG